MQQDMTKQQSRRRAEDLFRQASTKTLSSLTAEFFEALRETSLNMNQLCLGHASLENSAIDQTCLLERDGKGDLPRRILTLAECPSYRGSMRESMRLRQLSINNPQHKALVGPLSFARAFWAGEASNRAKERMRANAAREQLRTEQTRSSE
jgi:hypothetical protein